MRFMSLATGVLAVVGLIGCSSQPSTAPVELASPPNRTASAAGAKYRLDAEPAGARNVADVRAGAADGEKVVVVGRIGGDVNPWVEGRAAFTIVDLSLQACSDIPGDSCPTPWDYCCEADLPKATLLVSIRDSGGRLVKTDARELLGVSELDTVVVQGNAQRDSDGNVSIVARKVYVAPAKQE